MHTQNEKDFCDRKISDYWNKVDLYIGGKEHAVGHLLYSRMWTKALYDLGYIGHDEPYKKLVNQGMIQGSSRFVYRFNGTDIYLSKGYADRIVIATKKELKEIIHEINRELSEKVFDDEGKMIGFNFKYIPSAVSEDEFQIDTENGISPIRIPVEFVDGYYLDVNALKASANKRYQNSYFISEGGKYICGSEVEKMSKSKFNTVNPDDLVAKYGADTFHMYEMFLGPVEMSKPWDTKGIEGVHRFLKKLWRLFFDEIKGKVWTEEKATDAELKVLHKTIKKIEDDTERFSFNTGVSTFMIAVNELTDLKCHKKEILEPLLILLTPYAPHIAEELYAELRKVSPPTGGGDLEGVSILNASFPVFEAKYVAESSKEY